MSWTVTAGQPVPVDLLRSQVSLLIRGDGANNSTAISDLSPTTKAITVTGARISTAVNDPFGANTGVIYFDNTGDYLTVASGIGIAFPANFTAEMWVYRLDTSSDLLIDARSASITENFHIGATPSLATAGAQRLTHQTTFATNQWYHLALVRNSGLFTLYVDGVASSGTYSESTSYLAASTGIRIGSTYTNGNIFNGYLSNIRITQAARYTSGFTPPTAPFPDI